MSKVYVVHYCKNPKCNNAFIDVDLFNAQCKPPKHKYCEECVSMGFINQKLDTSSEKIKRIKKSA